MILLVCGGRDFNDRETIFSVLDRIDAKKRIEKVVTGAHPQGADAAAEAWAKKRQRPYAGWPAEWDNLDVPGAIIKVRRADGKRYNAAAGPMRNGKMLRAEQPDAVLGFPGGDGTADCVAQAKEMGIQVVRVDAQGKVIPESST